MELNEEKTVENISNEDKNINEEIEEILELNIESKKYDRKYLEENGFNVEEGIKLLGDMEAYDEMLEGFIEETENRINLFKKYI